VGVERVQLRPSALDNGWGSISVPRICAVCAGGQRAPGVNENRNNGAWSCRNDTRTSGSMERVEATKGKESQGRNEF
jgi:hypothetical protein